MIGIYPPIGNIFIMDSLKSTYLYSIYNMPIIHISHNPSVGLTCNNLEDQPFIFKSDSDPMNQIDTIDDRARKIEIVNATV